MKSSIRNTVLILVLISLLMSCADSESIVECLTDNTYGFWSGFWHGIISVISFICSLFYDDISVYAVNNNGAWYDFGFLIGVGSAGGSAASVRTRKQHI